MTLVGDTPRWQKVAAGVLLLAVLGVVVFVAVLVINTNGSVDAVNTQGARRDCVTTLSTARRSVFDNVDIYKAIEIQLLSGALLDNANGIMRSQAEKDRVRAIYQANDDQLKAALVEARRLQPAKTLDDLIAHGGMVDGVHYDGCPV